MNILISRFILSANLLAAVGLDAQPVIPLALTLFAHAVGGVDFRVGRR